MRVRAHRRLGRLAGRLPGSGLETTISEVSLHEILQEVEPINRHVGMRPAGNLENRWICTSKLPWGWNEAPVN